MTDSRVKPGDDPSGRTSPSLLARAVAREAASWERLVSLYTPLLRHWCRRWGLQAADTDEVCQESFAAVARALPDFEHAGGSFRGWLRTIARHKAVDYLRRAGKGVTGAGGSEALTRLHRLEAPDDDEVPDLAAERRLLYRRALRIIRDSFAESDWQAFDRVVCRGQTPADVARDLNVTVNKVYLAKSRILRKLRAEFRDLIDDGS